MRSDLILFTPGPVRIPRIVADYLADPPCNYHRQEAFRDMFARTESDLKTLLGIRKPERYFATLLTATGTGANEASLLALSGAGRGLIVRNGFFSARLVDQAVAARLDHAVLDLPHDRPIDPDAVTRACDADPAVRWVFFVSHETRMGLANPLTEVAQACKRKGLLVAADCISSSYAYPIDIEEAGLDIAVSSSAKALQAAPGLGIVFVDLEALPALRRGTRPYYLDLVAELDKQRAEHQPRFAQPVALHAAVRAACENLTQIGMDNHIARIRRQMTALIDHLATLGIQPMLAAPYRSGVAVNFRLPGSIGYSNFSGRMVEAGFFVLYGIPGDDSHFQLSTIGDLDDAHIDGINRAFSRVFSAGGRAM